MTLTSKKEIKSLLKRHKIKPLKKLGQNFLIDKQGVKKIIETAQVKPSDNVLEIGPGLGTLTIKLAEKAKKVIAIEKDFKMVKVLEETLKNYPKVKIVSGDVLKVSHLQYPKSKYKVVANLPYYIVSPTIRNFLEKENPPVEMTLIVQKEIGQRICAKPPKMSLLTVSVQFYAKTEIVSYLSKKSFWPLPKVDSVIIKIIPYQSLSKGTYFKKEFRERFFKIVKAGFCQPRKQLLNNFSKGLKLDKEKVKSWLLKNNINPEQRAESLSLKDWIKLTQF